MALISREQFAAQVFARDKNTCVVPNCNAPAVDPHHIIERRLFCDGDPLPGGYDVNNGASLCEIHHIHAEKGYFPPQALRYWIGIKTTILPAICKKEKLYDKWGDEIAKASHVHVKYPKTPYLNFSPSYDKTDRYINTKDLINKPLSVTVKKDGSCITMTKEICGARNGYEADHPSFNMLKQRHAILKHNIPEGIQLFGEWLYAKHSIHYIDSLALQDYLEIFAVYDQTEQLFLGQDDVKNLCNKLNLISVTQLASICYATEWELIGEITALAEKAIARGEEGVVVKSIYPYHFSQFSINVAKYVKSNFVPGSSCWENKIIRNEIKT